MAAESLADLVRMAQHLRIRVTHSRRGSEPDVNASPHRIALVDDDPRLLGSLENLLESPGCVDDADAREFQRHVDPGIVLHGRLSMMLAQAQA